MKNPRLFFQLILSRGVGVPFPIMSTFLYYFNEHNLYREIDSNYRPCEYESHATNQLSYLGIKTTPTILEVGLIMLLLCHSYMWPALRPQHPHNIVNISNIQHLVQSRFYISIQCSSSLDTYIVNILENGFYLLHRRIWLIIRLFGRTLFNNILFFRHFGKFPIIYKTSIFSLFLLSIWDSNPHHPPRPKGILPLEEWTTFINTSPRIHLFFSI